MHSKSPGDRLGRRRIDVVKRERYAALGSKSNQLLSHTRRNGLPMLVKRHIALRHANFFGDRFLRQPEPFSNGFELSHRANISDTADHCQQCHLLPPSAPTYMVDTTMVKKLDHDTQEQEAAALQRLFKWWQQRRQTEGQPWSQEYAAAELGFGQSALSQYLRGKIPLNIQAAILFSRLLGCEVAEISPRLAEEVAELTEVVSKIRQPAQSDQEHHASKSRLSQTISRTKMTLNAVSAVKQALPNGGLIAQGLATLGHAALTFSEARRVTVFRLLSGLILKPDEGGVAETAAMIELIASGKLPAWVEERIAEGAPIEAEPTPAEQATAPEQERAPPIVPTRIGAAMPGALGPVMGSNGQPNDTKKGQKNG